MSGNSTGILTPFRRDKKKDFAFGFGLDLIRSKIIQALAAEGETPWRTDFGSGLEKLRHQQNSDVLAELARVYVIEALRRWVPEVDVLEVAAERGDSALYLRISFRLRAEGKENVLQVAIET